MNQHSDQQSLLLQIQKLHQQCAELERSREQISGSWQFASSQLQAAEVELGNCHRIIHHLQQQVQFISSQSNDRTQQLMRATQEKALMEERRYREMRRECASIIKNAEYASAGQKRNAAQHKERWQELRSELSAALHSSTKQRSESNLADKLDAFFTSLIHEFADRDAGIVDNIRLELQSMMQNTAPPSTIPSPGPSQSPASAVTTQQLGPPPRPDDALHAFYPSS